MKKFFILLCLSSSLLSAVKAQTWTVGIPVDTTLSAQFIGYGALTGCFPSASAVYNFNIPSVSGIQFSLVVNSVDANSCYIMPGNDTLQTGDTIWLNSGVNQLSVFYFAPSNTLPLQMSFRATGTPTTMGQPWPCNLPSPFMYMSNLMFCPEGLNGNISTNCTVLPGSNPTGINREHAEQWVLQYPVAANGNRLQLGRTSNLTVYDLQGRKILHVPQAREVELAHLPSGLYLVRLQSGKASTSTQLQITH